MKKTTKASRFDGWSNVLTGAGTSRDKRLSSTFYGSHMGSEEAEEMWLSSDMAARIVDLPPLIQMRNGMAVLISQLDASDGVEAMAEHVDDFEKLRGEIDDIEEEVSAEELTDAQAGMAAALDELQAVPAFIEAAQWARLYGGCAMLMGLDDGQTDLSKPVRWNTLRGVRYLINLRPRECWPVSWNTNPTSAGYGRPVVYQVRRETGGGLVDVNDGFKVHAQRIIRFEGVKASRRHDQGSRGWGRSVLERVAGHLRDFDQSYEAIPILLQDFAQGVLKMEGAAELFGSADGEAIISRRIAMVDQMRSTLRMMWLDSKDSFERQQTPVSGLPEMLDRIANRFAASADIPVNLLFGSSPAGLSATGDANVRWFYDALKADRDLHITPKVNQLVRAIFRALEGPTQGQEPGRWSVEFGSMWLATEAEIADVRLKTSQADVAYVQAGVLLPEEVAASRFGGDKWNPETRLDMAARSAAAAESPAPPPLEMQASAEVDPQFEETASPIAVK